VVLSQPKKHTGYYGWEIDHKKPVANRWIGNLRNLRPLYWKENRTNGR